MRRRLAWLVLLSAATVMATLTTGTSVSAQSPTHFTGSINDFTPETTVSPTGPWELHGTWQLAQQGNSGTANFSAQLTMELSDYSIVCCGVNPDSPPARMPHTHIISLVGGQVTQLTGGGFEVTGGSLVILKNGSPVLTSSTLTINVSGGTNAAYSNISLTFGGDAGGHFGTQAMNGVVQTSY